jgi:hypothetical protein
VHDPDGRLTVSISVLPASVGTAQSTDQEQPEGHECKTDEEHGTTTPFVDVDDGRDGQGDVESVLDGGGLEVGFGAGDTGSLEDVDDVVPAKKLYQHHVQDRERWKRDAYIMTFIPVN